MNKTEINMNRIPSFSIDHTRLLRGIYLSRQDDDVMTWDVRIKEPNHGDYLSNGVSHTIEHLFATYARNSRFQHGVIYIGPMGCRTGAYFLTRGLSKQEVLDCVKESFAFIKDFEGEIPGAKVEECGNYLDHDLQGCREEAAKYLEVLEKMTVEDMEYKFYLD